MNRALAVLTCGAFVTLVAEATGLEHPLPPIVAALAFSPLSVLGFPLVDGHERRLRLGILYVLVQLPLSYLVFMTGSSGVGATLLSLVLVSQSVLLLPLPGAVLVTAVVPLVHLGMPMADGLRTMLGTYVAAAFTAVVTELLRREQRARADLAVANDRLRENAAGARVGPGARGRGPRQVLLVPFWAGAMGEHAMVTWGHVLMLPAMAAVMLLRPDEYAH